MRVLILGLGSIAKKHIKALREITEIELYALRSTKDSKDWEDVQSLFSIDEIDNFEFDFFIISNPTANHAQAIEKLLKHRKPLFIEKPLFDKRNPFNDKLVGKINAEKIPNYVACNLRFLDCLQEMKRIVSKSRINEVNIYCGSYLPDWRPDSDFRESYSANEKMGGGVHIDLIHELDYLYWFFGAPQESRATFRRKSHLEIKAVDYANYLLDYQYFCASVILNYYRRDPKRTFEIITSQSTFLVDLLENTIYEDGKEIYSSNQRIAETYLYQMKFFLKNVLSRSENSDFNTVNDAYKILGLCMEN